MCLTFLLLIFYVLTDFYNLVSQLLLSSHFFLYIFIIYGENLDPLMCKLHSESKSSKNRGRGRFNFDSCPYPYFLAFPNTSPRLHSERVCVCVCVCVCVSDSLQPHGLEPARLLCPWDSPGKNTVGCHFFLQRIFPTQGSNSHLLHLLHCRQIVNHCATCGTSDSIPHNNKS